MARLAGVTARGRPVLGCILPARGLGSFQGLSAKQCARPLVATWRHDAQPGPPWAPARAPPTILARQASQGARRSHWTVRENEAKEEQQLGRTHRNPGLEENCGGLVSASLLAPNEVGLKRKHSAQVGSIAAAWGPGRNRFTGCTPVPPKRKPFYQASRAAEWESCRPKLWDPPTLPGRVPWGRITDENGSEG